MRRAILVPLIFTGSAVGLAALLAAAPAIEGVAPPAGPWNPPPAASPSSPAAPGQPDNPASPAGAANTAEETRVVLDDREPAPPPPVRSQLQIRPVDVKAIYLTSWSAATPGRLAWAVSLIKRSELNAVVIDIKDYTGKVVFVSADPLIAAVGSSIPRLNLADIVRRLHEDNIYVIVRIAAFQDQHLVAVRPDLAVRDSAGRIWRDRKGLGWVDPASAEVWRYLVAVAREAAAAGVDELNFDYIRFPSDGTLTGIRYPVFDDRTRTRRQVLQEFFAYLTTGLRDAGPVLSADLFGLATVREDDLGIGQVVEDALLHFDVVAPMVYPSHYARGFLGYRNPAAHPYEVVLYSLRRAVERRTRLAGGAGLPRPGSSQPTGPPAIGQIRPWLQAFDLGAPYPPQAVRRQIQAVADAGLAAGWLIWNPANRYQPASFKPE
jgi:hypothetical protein